MKHLLFAVCSALLVAPTLLGSAIYNSSASLPVSWTANGGSNVTYTLVAQGNHFSSSGFDNSADSVTDNTAFTVSLDFGALAGTSVSAATLALSSALTATQPPAYTVSFQDGGGAGHGADPTFSGAPSGMFVSIVGTLSGTQTINLASTTNYNLLPFFSQDLQAGKSLKISMTLSDVFSATLPSTANWKNTTATYTNFSQLVSGTFSASSSVTYETSATPEPATLLISGGGLLLLSIAGRKLKRA
jgi:hypothetical protein